MKSLKFFLLFVISILLFNQFEFAQINGIIMGTIIADDTGEFIPNVIVKLIKIHSHGSAQIRDTKTDSNGYFMFNAYSDENRQ